MEALWIDDPRGQDMDRIEKLGFRYVSLCWESLLQLEGHQRLDVFDGHCSDIDI